MHEKILLKIKRLAHSEGLPLPKYMSVDASGMDLIAAVKDELTLEPFERKLIPTGLIMEIPHGFEVQIRPRSGLALKKGLSIPNAPGTIDADYRGEVNVIMINLSKEPLIIKRGERIAQAVLAPVYQAEIEEVEAVVETQRGSGGFGSTGIKH